MGEGKPSSTSSTPATSSTPETMENHTGSATSTHGANTNLDPSMQGGAGTAADKAATQDAVEQHQQQGLPTGIAGQSDPAKQMDNSGMLNPTGEGSDADQMGASGVDRNSDD
ncbi:hypothetical protein ACFFLM_01750 [Deinococcus oregonensis]|uniref:Uncharacterized protein n=1 Tax=Deinococcus oregonensis TaxID=1805970 RepID=A0ABV6AT99_9DEIO